MRASLLAAAAVVLAGCGSTTPPAASPPPATSAAPGITRAVPASPTPDTTALRLVHDPGHVTGTIQGPCRFRDGGRLPDPRCTPGAVDPQLTAARLCAAGYRTSAYRPPASETGRFKRTDALPAYGLTWIRGTRAELDHLVPLELGGANDAANLWPELGRIPNPKDKVEGDLHDAVCAGRVALADAQRAIAANWQTAAQQLGVTP